MGLLLRSGCGTIFDLALLTCGGCELELAILLRGLSFLRFCVLCNRLDLFVLDLLLLDPLLGTVLQSLREELLVELLVLAGELVIAVFALRLLVSVKTQDLVEVVTHRLDLLCALFVE